MLNINFDYDWMTGEVANCITSVTLDAKTPLSYPIGQVFRFIWTGVSFCLDRRFLVAAHIIDPTSAARAT